MKILLEDEIVKLAKLCQNDPSMIDILIDDLGKIKPNSIKIKRDKKSGFIRVTFMCHNIFYDDEREKLDLLCTLDISENAASYKRKQKERDSISRKWNNYHYYSVVSYDSYFDYQFTKLSIGPPDRNRYPAIPSRYIEGKHKREIFYGTKKLIQDETDLSEIYISGLRPPGEPEFIIENPFALEILKAFSANQKDHDIDCRLDNNRYLLLPENGVLNFMRGLSTCTEGDNAFANVDRLNVGNITNSDFRLSRWYYGALEEFELVRRFTNGSLTEGELKEEASKLLVKYRSKGKN